MNFEERLGPSCEGSSAPKSLLGLQQTLRGVGSGVPTHISAR